MSLSDRPKAAKETAAACVLCGATQDLVRDEQVEGVFYCPKCLERHRRHGQQIEDRGEPEPSWDG